MSDTNEIEVERKLTELAGALLAPGTISGTLSRIVDLAVADIDGCDAAGILVLSNQSPTTAASTDLIVAELDQLQFDTGEGPSLDAISESRTFYAIDLADDEQWRRFGPPASLLGFRSVLAFRLLTREQSALSLYARLPAAFSPTDRAKGALLATLASVVLDSVEHRAEHEATASNLLQALRTRELIGQAQGILMERERITPDQAFDILRRASQHLNTKLRTVAETLVETGETPSRGPLSPPP